MADTVDLRSEGKNSQSKSAVESRKRRKRLKYEGLCTICGITPIGGSRTSACYECSKLQSRRTYKSGLRFFLKLVGADYETVETLTTEQISELLNMARMKE